MPNDAAVTQDGVHGGWRGTCVRASCVRTLGLGRPCYFRSACAWVEHGANDGTSPPPGVPPFVAKRGQRGAWPGLAWPCQPAAHVHVRQRARWAGAWRPVAPPRLAAQHAGPRVPPPRTGWVDQGGGPAGTGYCWGAEAHSIVCASSASQQAAGQTSRQRPCHAHSSTHARMHAAAPAAAGPHHPHSLAVRPRGLRCTASA